MSKTKSCQDYWKTAILPILSFSVYMGLRFGRLIDYNLYYFRYQEIGKGISEDDYEFVFRCICYILYQMGVPYYLFIYISSVAIIITCFKLIQKYRYAGPYLTLMLLVVLTPVEQLVRWYLAIIFLIMGYMELEKGKYTRYFIWGIICTFVHVGYFPLVIFIFFLRFYGKPIFNSKIALILLFVTTFILDVSILHVFDNYIGLLSVNDRTNIYVDNYSNLIDGEFGRLGISTLQFSGKLRTFIAYSFPLWQTSILVKGKKITPTLANLTYLALILTPLFSQLEILSRYTATILCFAAIPIGISYYNVFKSYKNNKLIKNIFAILSLLAIIYPLIAFTFLGRDEWYKMLFIWDANDKEYLNPEYFRIKL